MARRTGRTGKKGGNTRAWVVAAACVMAFVTVAVAYGTGGGSRTHHPEARPLAEQPPIVPSTSFAGYPRVAETYEMAAAIPMILDGLYCYCQCSEHSGHHGLLDCFASDHAARCDVCMSEAVVAYRMSQDGATLDQIRAEVDRIYGT